MVESPRVCIVTRDIALVASLDEPLQRRNFRGEWLQHAAPLVHRNDLDALHLLILDLQLSELRKTDLFTPLQATGCTLVCIPPHTGGPVPTPRGATRLLVDRSPERLLALVRQLLGTPGRIFPRRPYDACVYVRPQDAEGFTARGCDIGPGGVYIESSRGVTPGTRVSLQLLDAAGQTALASDGCAAWQRFTRHGAQPLFGTGIQFLFPDRRKLQQLLATPRPQTPSPVT